jgi:hypothetical protein
MTTLPAVTNAAPSQSHDLDRKHRNQNYRTGHDETWDRVRLHPTHEHQRGCDSANPPTRTPANICQSLRFMNGVCDRRRPSTNHKAGFEFANDLLRPAPAGQYPAPSSLGGK